MALVRSLAVNDENERLIVSRGIIPHLVGLAQMRNDDLLRRDAVKTIRSLSFAGFSLTHMHTYYTLTYNVI